MSDASAPYAPPDPAEAELAVVIVNYNAGDYLERCLGSLAAHRGDVAVDVLVIDNDSRDASHVVALASHPWARLIENPTNVLLSPAWNQGIRETKAPYVLLLNPDAEVWRGTLADYLAVARAHPRAGIVGPQVRNPDGTVYASGRPFPGVVDAVGHALLGSVAPGNPFTRRYRQEGWDRASERTVDWVSGCCMLIPRDALDDVHGFDEAFALYGEELDIATRLRDAGWSVLFTPEVEVIHQIGVSTGRSRRMLVTHSNSIYRYFRKHRAAGWRRLTLPFAWALLRLRAEIEWVRGRMGRS
jgi:N-acetylglucosaminyl-diphospho-decaprenol L-rhamnosyltransferase